MMKIIKDNTKYPKIAYCKKCHSVIEYEEKDEEKVDTVPTTNSLNANSLELFLNMFAEFNEEKTCIKCPVCGEWIEVCKNEEV